MIAAIGILATLALIGWLIFRGVRDKSIKAHTVSYAVAVIAGVFTYGYLLSLDYPKLIKIVVSILLGILLIVLAALRQRRTADGTQKGTGEK
jgi:hypothetical protein